MKSQKSVSSRVALLGVFAAVTVVLQLLSYTIKIGTFNLSLVLIPIVLSAVLYGIGFGAVIGGVFGATVLIAAMTGLDGGGYIMFSASPLATVAVCMLKGIAAGAAAGAVSKLIKPKNEYIAAIAAAVTAPIVNTGLFVAFLPLFFRDLLFEWAGGTPTAYYILFSLVGINFVIEFVINAVMSPILYRLICAVKKLHI